MAAFTGFDDDSGFLLHQTEKPSFLKSNLMGYKLYSNSNCCQSGNSTEELYEEDNLDAESILDEEIQEGIDSIMGNFKENSHVCNVNSWYGNPIGGKFQIGSSNNGLRKGVTAFRHTNQGNWWNFPIVDMLQISPRLSRSSSSSIDSKKGEFNLNLNSKSKKLNSGEKKKKKVEKLCLDAELKNSESVKENSRELWFCVLDHSPSSIYGLCCTRLRKTYQGAI